MELVQLYIDRIKLVNPFLNAVVVDRFAEALIEAKQADEKLASGQYSAIKQPFLGVPCTIKESLKLTGMPHSAGLKSRMGLGAAKEDSPAVAKLRTAGLYALSMALIVF